MNEHFRTKLNRRTSRLLESLIDDDERYVDPMEPFRDADGGWLLATGGDYRRDGASGMIPGFNEAFLTELRTHCRALAATNEFAINAQENRVNYVVGQGHRYRVIAFEKRDEKLAAKVHELLESFLDRNRWHRRQQEIVRRRDRDGEVFLRLFRDRLGEVSIRFVEPDQVFTPEGHVENPAMSFGIHTEERDVEAVLGYWIDGEYVEAPEIQHRKANVDANVKRGLPLFYPVRKNLRRAEKLLRNMSVVAEIQSAIALIRKHGSGSAESVRRYVRNQADTSIQDATGTKTLHFRKLSPGTIVDAHAGIDYEFPIAGIDAGSFIEVLQAELRAIASRLVMPEFMLTSDASNANYSSTMIAEGPAVRMFERLQHEMIEEDLSLFSRVVEAAVDVGRLPEDTLSTVAVHAIPPILAVRDRHKESLADKVLVELGVLSKQTLAMRHGLDPDHELSLMSQ